MNSEMKRVGKWTPGPWHLRGDTVLVKPSLQICQIDRGNKHPDTALANAQLIAATPELVEALAMALDRLETIVRKRDGLMGDEFHAIMNARAALKKAGAL